MIAVNGNRNHIGFLQKIFIRSLIARAENYFQSVLSKRQPKCLMALENKDPIAYIVIYPSNLRGTCWSITLPVFIKEPKSSSKRNIRQILIKEVIESGRTCTQSWLIKCSTNDNQQLSLARELGFQPLKIIKRWKLQNKQIKNLIKNKEISLSSLVKIENLNKENAILLWKLQQSKESLHLKNIFDQHWSDVLNKNTAFTKLIMSYKNSTKSFIAALLTPVYCEKDNVLELIRDIAWDDRLNASIPYLIKEVMNSRQEIYIENSCEDVKLNNVLVNLGLYQVEESILLGRNIWRRQNKQALKNRSISIATIIQDLGQQQPQLPAQ
tara:strand:+ start:1121 stop:2095 length:975 start_codon:yes stop_codon:yes gene_type:complete